MKKMNKTVLTILAFITVLSVMPVYATPAQGPFKEAHLWAGRGRGPNPTYELSGIVTFAIVGDNLVVTFQAYGDWLFNETNLYVGTTPPAKPAPGKFPYGHEDLGGVPTDQYVIPLADLGVSCGDTLYLAVHAVVTNSSGREETAWGGLLCGVPFDRGWGAYFWATIPCADA